MFYQLQKSNLNTYLLYCWNVTNYIYILRRFRKLVIIFFIVKNTLNLINLSSFHGVKIVTWQKKNPIKEKLPHVPYSLKKKKIHIKNFLPTSTTPSSYNLKIKKFKTTYSSYKNKKKRKLPTPKLYQKHKKNLPTSCYKKKPHRMSKARLMRLIFIVTLVL